MQFVAIHNVFFFFFLFVCETRSVRAIHGRRKKQKKQNSSRPVTKIALRAGGVARARTLAPAATTTTFRGRFAWPVHLLFSRRFAARLSFYVVNIIIAMTVLCGFRLVFFFFNVFFPRKFSVGRAFSQRGRTAAARARARGVFRHTQNLPPLRRRRGATAAKLGATCPRTPPYPCCDVYSRRNKIKKKKKKTVVRAPRRVCAPGNICRVPVSPLPSRNIE